MVRRNQPGSSTGIWNSSNCRYVRERLRPRSGLGLADQGSELILLGVPQDTEQVCEGQVRVLLGGCPSGRKVRMASARCCSSSNSSGCQAVRRSLAGPSARVGQRRERNVEAVTAERGEMQPRPRNSRSTARGGG